MTRRNKFIISFTSILLILCANFFINASNSYAKQIVITKSQITKIFTKTIQKKATEGSTITEDYYVYTDWQNDRTKGTVNFVSRSTGKKVAKVSGKWGHMSALDYEWGSNYLRIVNSDDSSKDGCIDLATFKTVGISNCVGRVSDSIKNKISSNISNGLQQQAVPIKFNDYYFKTAYQKKGSKAAYIYVFDSKGNKLQTYKIPRNIVNAKEIEDISVDGNTGDVYISYNRGKGQGGSVLFYKIDHSVFGKYTQVDTKPNTESSNSSSSGSPSSSDNSKSSTNSPSQPSNSSNNQSSNSSDSSSSKQKSSSANTVILTDQGIEGILNLIRNILVAGVPIVGIIGITIVGIQYITAGGDESKTAKAKRRMFEIVIGLALYAVGFALLYWLGIAG